MNKLAYEGAMRVPIAVPCSISMHACMHACDPVPIVMGLRLAALRAAGAPLSPRTEILLPGETPYKSVLILKSSQNRCLK